MQSGYREKICSIFKKRKIACVSTQFRKEIFLLIIGSVFLSHSAANFHFSFLLLFFEVLLVFIGLLSRLLVGLPCWRSGVRSTSNNYFVQVGLVVRLIQFATNTFYILPSWQMQQYILCNEKTNFMSLNKINCFYHLY